MGCSSSVAYSSPKQADGTESATPAADIFASLFGETLQGKKGEISTTKALAGATAIAIYFSAHWCPPCRGFTPSLAKAYTKSLKAKGMEVVFVSSDQSEKEFNSYFKTMPWLAVPFADRAAKERLSKKFKVQGIPSLVILDAEGNTITTDGRSKVASDPQGESFPWRPRPFAELIGETFLKGDDMVGKEAIAGKTIGIYFSAHWCPPCRSFTPKLAQHYKAYKEAGLPLEIIFATGDRDESQFKSYYKEMQSEGGDWLAIPWANSANRTELNSLFEVSGIPCLVIVDENGRVINKNARGAVANDATGEGFPWAPPAVGDLASPEGLNDTPSLCIFMDGVSPEHQKAMTSEVQRVSERYIAASKTRDEDAQYRFFTARNSEGPVSRVRIMCGLPSDDASSPKMLILDIADNGAFYKSDETSITEATIEAFIKAYEAKTIERQQLKPPQ